VAADEGHQALALSFPLGRLAFVEGQVDLAVELVQVDPLESGVELAELGLDAADRLLVEALFVPMALAQRSGDPT